MIFIIAVAIIAIAALFTKRVLEISYFRSLPKTLKNQYGTFTINKSLLRKLEKTHAELLKAARSKFLSDRGPIRILDDENARLLIDKFIHVYVDDFNTEIRDGKLDWNNENTKLFFELLDHKYKITNRALLRTLLYLRHEIDYFTYRDSILVSKPKTLDALLKQSVKFVLTNEKVSLQPAYVKRAACELNLGFPLFAVQPLLDKAKKELELNQFEKDFKDSNNRIKESSNQRLTRLSWEEMLNVASGQGISISQDRYLVSAHDHSRDSRIDRFFKNRMKFAIIQHFGGQCVDCTSPFELELDHFWHPKSKGGNFAMRSKEGFYVSNCIPLCRSCNASKGAKDIFDVFGGDKIKELLAKSSEFGPFLNAHLQEFADDQFVNFSESSRHDNISRKAS